MIDDDDGRNYLPYDVDIEQALLGAVLVNERDLMLLQEGSGLSDRDFYDPVHRRIWGALVHKFNRGELASALTIAAALADDPGLTEIGGTGYLLNLARAAPALPNVKDYARILRDLAVRRRIVVIGEDLARGACRVSENADAVALADNAAEAIFDAAHFGSASEPQPIIEVIDLALAKAELAMNNPRKARILTGLPCLDTALGGLFMSDLTVLGGAPSMGKSGLAGQFALAAARDRHGAMMFSKEMSATEFVLRYMAEAAAVPANRIIEGRISNQEFRKIADTREAIGDIPYLIDESANLTVAQIRARTLAARRRVKDVGLCVIDHLRFVAPANPRAEERDQIQQITRDLKAMAKEFHIAVLLISHLNRDFWRRSSHRPMVSDLYGSAAIEQNADHIWFVHREHYYLEREPPPKAKEKEYYEWEQQLAKEEGWAEVFSAKRRGGPTGKARLKFNAPLVSFADPDVNEDQSALDLSALAAAP